MRAGARKRDGASGTTAALSLPFKAHQNHFQHIIDVRVYVVIEHSDDAIALALEIGCPASIIGDLVILRVGRAVDLDNEPLFPGIGSPQYMDRSVPAEQT